MSMCGERRRMEERRRGGEEERRRTEEQGKEGRGKRGVVYGRSEMRRGG